jgi:hypothetical protein
LQYAVLALTAAGAILAGHRILAAPALWGDQPLGWARVVGLAAALMAIVVLRWPRHTTAAVTLACVIVAAALMTPAPVVTVALLFSAALLVGEAAAGRTDDPPSAAVATLIGVSLWIGVFAVTARLRIHYAPVYALIAFAALIVCHERVRARVVGAWVSLITPRSATPSERAWIGVAGVVAIVHVVVAARPEVGFDASTIHQQFAELVAADHRFRYGIDRYIWAMMPLGADYAFATAYVMGGESAARALNLSFGVLATVLVYQLGRFVASREAALACATLFAAMPLAMLITASLFSESLWVALLLASLAVLLGAFERRTSFLPSFAILAGGAMATKVMGIFWLVILVPAAVGIAYRDRSIVPIRRRDAVLIAIGVAIGAWHYVAAWITTGNPVFPFMNAVFRSPFFAVAQSFNNPIYNVPLTPWTPWELVVQSGRFIEGRDGALGLAWLFAAPLVLLHFIRRPPLRFHLIALLAIVFFVAIYVHQSYLRYLLPAFALVAVLASGALADLVRTRSARIVLLAAGIALVAFDLRTIANAHYPLAAPCSACLFDARARARYVETYAPLRAVAARLNRDLPDARVGFLLPNEPAPAGYVGPSRVLNWHDYAFYRAFAATATSAEALGKLARDHGMTHIVYRATPDPAFPSIAAFASRHATPLWRVGDYVVAVLQPGSGG